MEWFFLVLCIILLKDIVQSSFVLNNENVNPQSNPYVQTYSNARNGYDSNTYVQTQPNEYNWQLSSLNSNSNYGGYMQQQEQQQQQQYENNFQNQQQYSTQYQQYPQYAQIPGGPTESQLGWQTNADQNANEQPLVFLSEQQQWQTLNKEQQPPQPYSNFQQQYQTNQVLHEDGQQYKAYQYQYQDGMSQTQEQRLIQANNGAEKLPAEKHNYPNAMQGGQILHSEYNTQGQESQTQTSSINVHAANGDFYNGMQYNEQYSGDGSNINLNTNYIVDPKYQKPSETSRQYLPVPQVNQNPLNESLFHIKLQTILVRPTSTTKPTLHGSEEKTLQFHPIPVKNSNNENFEKTSFISNSNTNSTGCLSGILDLLAIPENCLTFLENKNVTTITEKVISSSIERGEVDGSPETLDNFCINKTFGSYAHPFDCSKFMQCSSKGQSEADCTPGTAFNVKSRKCANIHEVECRDFKPIESKDIQGILCPQGVSGQFPYPFSSEHFINCTNSETVIESCPSYTTFNPSKLYCEAATIVQQSSYSSTKLNTFEIKHYLKMLLCPTSTSNGSYLYPYDPEKYILCHNDRMQIMSCTIGDVFSLSKGLCVNRYQTDLFDRVRSIQYIQTVDANVMLELYKQYDKIECPMEVLGVFPYPFANRQYLKCVDGRMRIKHCGRGYLYSISRRLCDIPDHILTFDTAVPVAFVAKAFDEAGHLASKGVVSFLKCPLNVTHDTFVFPFSNTRYTKCSNGVTSIQTCLNGAVYSIRQKRCLPRNQIDSNDYVEGIETSMKRFSNDHTLGVICGPKNLRSFAHPEDRGKFVICENGNVVVKMCDKNKFFSIMQQKCV